MCAGIILSLTIPLLACAQARPEVFADEDSVKFHVTSEAELVGVNGTTLKKGLRPNIVFFLADDQSKFDHTVYGNEMAPTPTVEALAEEGLVFEHAYTGQAICAPSRSMLYTGLEPIRNGCFINHTAIRPGVRTITHYMAELGYEVILAGKSHVSPSEQFEWTKRFRPVSVEGLPRSSIPIEEIDAFLAAPSDKPFCMIVASEYPHPPHFKDTPFLPDDVKLQPFIEETDSNLLAAARYYASIAEKEKELAAVLDSLEQHGLKKDTIVFYSDDHGSKRGKFTVYDTGLNVAFMVRWPGQIKAGRSDALISYSDFVPTVIELAGGVVPEGLDGKSLLPLFEGNTDKHHDYVYGVATNQGIQRRSLFPIRSVHDGRYHYIFNFNSMERLERDLVAGLEIDYFREYGAKKYKSVPEEELYDTEVDPFELSNLADKDRLAGIKARLKTELFRHIASQGDFLTETGSLPVFKLRKHELDESNPEFDYYVPEDLEGSLEGKKVEPYAITGGPAEG